MPVRRYETTDTDYCLPGSFLDYERRFDEHVRTAEHAGSPSTARSARSTARQALRYWWDHLRQPAPPPAEIVPLAPNEDRTSSTSSFEAFLAAEPALPFLAVLASITERMARAYGHQRPRNAVYLTRQFLQAAAGTDFEGNDAIGAFAIPPDWLPLIQACPLAYPTQTGTAAAAASSIRRLAKLALLHGVTGPQRLPDVVVIERWMNEAGWRPGSQKAVLCFYRKVRGAIGQHHGGDSAVTLRRRPNKAYKNLPTEPVVQQLIEAQGLDVSPAARVALIRAVAPKFGAGLEVWMKLEGAALRQPTREAMVDAVDRIVAVLLRGGYGDALSTLSPLDLFSRQVDLRQEESQIPTEEYDEDLRELGLERTELTAKVPLLLALAEQRASEPSRMRPQFVEDDRSPYYSGLLLRDTEQLWYLVEAVWKSTMIVRDPQSWAVVMLAHNRVREHIERRRAETGADRPFKNKPLLLRTITYPQLVCVGLPVLREHVLTRQRAWRTIVAEATRCGHTQAHPAVVQALQEYVDVLERYIVIAVFTSDPMREKNLTYGRLGTNCEIRITLATGTAGDLVIREVRTRFTGTGDDYRPAALKKEHGAIRQQREREWRWHPAIVDYDLLAEYLILVRAARVRARAELAALAPRQKPLPDARDHRSALLAASVCDGLSLFIAPEGSMYNDRGGFRGGTLSKLYGEALLWVARVALHRDVPEDIHAAGKEWYGIWAAHSARDLFVTYWYGVRGASGPRRSVSDGTVQEMRGIDIAVDGTNDSEQTLAGTYNAVSATMKARMTEPPGHVEHPNAYDRWLNQAHWREPIDWSMAWEEPTFPLPGHLQQKRQPSAALETLPATSRRPRMRSARRLIKSQT